jgi:hypothetical protein
MQVSQSWIDQIVELIKSKSHIFAKKSDEHIRTLVEKWFLLPYNVSYTLSCDQYDKFQYFLINVVAHQLNNSVHPLTCGVDSSHALLVPRIDYNNNNYLICPTCCYIQTTAYLY